MLGMSLKRRFVMLGACVMAVLLLAPGAAFGAGVVDHDAGEGFGHAVLSDGSLWGWGYNGSGQLGDGTTETHLAPVRIGFGTTWAEVSSGGGQRPVSSDGGHVLAIKSNGELWSWGWNKDGQLGIGHAENTWVPDHYHSTPTRVGTASNWLAVAAGSDHSLALDGDFKIWAWGANNVGQLGTGTLVATSTPVLVSASPGPGRYWRRIIASENYSAAVASDGSVWQWGGAYLVPSQIIFDGAFLASQPTNDSEWGALSLTADRFSAALGIGELWTWNAGSVEPLFKDPQFIDVAEVRATDELPPLNGGMAIHADHSLWAYATTGGVLAPIHGASSRVLMGNATNWSKLSGGKNHFLISKSDGSLWGWGRNTWGQLGDGTEYDKAYPAQEPVRVILPTPIPNVVSMTRSDAVDRIKEMGFHTGSVTLIATTAVPITKVISQSPAPNTLVMPGGNVNIVVSAGPPIPVPNVVGMAEAAARTKIAADGLSVSTVTGVWDSVAPVGAVVSQTPVPGTEVIIGSKVALTVSKGPEPKTVPWTMGRTEAQARSTLASSGFVAGTTYKEYNTIYPAGLVSRTSPPASTQSFAGTTVNIYVSLGKPKPSVGTPKAPYRMRKGRAATIYGYLKPRHNAGTYPVRIYKWKKLSSGKWRSYGYESAKASNYYSYTKYSRSMSFPSTGKWKVKAYAPADSGHAAAWSSSYDIITVR